MNTFSASILLILICGVFATSRKWALISMIAGTLFLTQGAAIHMADFTFFPSRILGYCVFLRVMIKGEFPLSQFTKVDKVFTVLYIFTTFILLFRDFEKAPLWSARMFDVILTYVAFRGLIRSPEEWQWCLGVLAFLLVPYVVILYVESTTQHNLFDLVGATDPVWLRDDKVRCYGSFRHPSLLGSLGACFLPLYIGMWWQDAFRKRALLGASLCVAIVLFSYSGGPLGVLFLAIVGWLLWPLRQNMRPLRLSLCAGIFLLAMLMKAPVWYLLSKISNVTGGTGWHRAYLIESAFHHIDQWWLFGMRDDATAGWFPYVLEVTNGADITNQFLVFGLKAGIAAMVLFILVIYHAFSLVGQALQHARQSQQKEVEPLLWALGVALAAHVSNWMGISYFDQFNVLWILQFAALVSISEFTLLSPLPHPSPVLQDVEITGLNFEKAPI